MKDGSTVIEEYLYDDSGQRIKKTNDRSTTYYINQYYEVEENLGDIDTPTN